MSCTAFQRRPSHLPIMDAVVVGTAAWIMLVLPWSWVVMCVVAPVCEELVFRWGLQENLIQRRTSAWQAIVATALVFGLAHGVFRSWALAPWVVAPALFLGWVYQQGRAQGPKTALRHCVVWHSALNAMYLGLSS